MEAEAGGMCQRCGYDLTGLEDRRPCPECGLLVGLSRLPTDELKNTRPGWLRGLVMGSILVALGLLLVPIGSAVYAAISTVSEMGIRRAAYISSACQLPAAITAYAGLWLLSRSAHGAKPVITLRLVGLWVFPAAVLPAIAYHIAIVTDFSDKMSFTVPFWIFALGAAIPLVGYRRLADLSLRAPAPLLAMDLR